MLRPVRSTGKPLVTLKCSMSDPHTDVSTFGSRFFSLEDVAIVHRIFEEDHDTSGPEMSMEKV